MRRRLASLRCSNQTADTISCLWNKDGVFSTKCIYKQTTDGGLRCPYAKRIWRIKAPHKIRAFAWLLCKNAILTWDNLRKRGWNGPNRCILCKQASESVDHLFLTCPYSLSIWKDIDCSFRTGIPRGSVGDLWHQQNVRGYNRKKGTLYAAFCWFVWLERNTRTFNEVFSSHESVFQRIANNYHFWTGTSTGGTRTPQSAVRVQVDSEDSTTEGDD